MILKASPPFELRVELRERWQFALFGVVLFALITAVLWTGRACGLVEYWVERLPGELLTAPFGVSSLTVDWASYFGVGALVGLAYRRFFGYIGRATWELGALLGIAQWMLFGIVIAFIQNFLTYNFTVLPTYSILSSVEGFFMGWFILLLNCFYGGFMGALAKTPHPRAQEESLSKTAPGAPTIRKAA